jgi:hypothetical protein
MKYEDFEKFVREKCMYDTIYDDSDGRQILIIQMLDAYGMVDKALRARLAQPERKWQGLTDEDKKQIAIEANDKSEMTAWEYAHRVGNFTEAKLKEKNT